MDECPKWTERTQPAPSGPAGCRAARSRDPKIPIIALTANVSREDRDAYLAAGMDDFLTKPIDENRLFEALQKTGERLQASSAKPADRH